MELNHAKGLLGTGIYNNQIWDWRVANSISSLEFYINMHSSETDPSTKITINGKVINNVQEAKNYLKDLENGNISEEGEYVSAGITLHRDINGWVTCLRRGSFNHHSP